MDRDTLLIIAVTFSTLMGIELVIRVVGYLLGIFVVLGERQARVYVLFGNVVGVLNEPGIHFLWKDFGWKALFVHNLGQSYDRDLRLDQEYLRSTPVNSEEGAPMGIGVWYEMFISDPLAHVFKNTDPRGSLRASVGNATVRCLSNLALTKMLENRHAMSRTVRTEVSPQSVEWGYQLGSIYIRKVHFRDTGMIRQIEEKVVNRLRQVTSAIRQDGSNSVNLIASSAEREAAVEFAKAATMRLQIVGKALESIAADEEVANTLFAILEAQKMVESKARVTILPSGLRSDMLAQLTASSPRP